MNWIISLIQSVDLTSIISPALPNIMIMYFTSLLLRFGTLGGRFHRSRSGQAVLDILEA
jgi:hypothetical protein